MRITEAIAALATEYPMYSKSKLKAALKIEMKKAEENLAQYYASWEEISPEYVVRDALVNAREVIKNGALMPANQVHGAPLNADPTGNEVVAREGQTAAWKIANPIGSVATKGRTGLTAEEIEKINAATKVAERDAAPIRKFLGMS